MKDRDKKIISKLGPPPKPPRTIILSGLAFVAMGAALLPKSISLIMHGDAGQIGIGIFFITGACGGAFFIAGLCFWGYWKVARMHKESESETREESELVRLFA